MDLKGEKIICCGQKDNSSFFVYNLCKNKTKILEDEHCIIYYSDDYKFYFYFIKNIFNNGILFSQLKNLSKNNYVHYIFSDANNTFITNFIERNMDFTNFDYSIMYYPGEFLMDNHPFKISEYNHLKYFFSSTRTINEENWFTWEYSNKDKFFFDINYGLFYGVFKVGFNFTNSSDLDVELNRLNKVFVYTKAENRVGRIDSVKQIENIDRFYVKKFTEDDFFNFKLNAPAIHFPNPLDYNKCKFNLVLETLDFTYDMTYFLSEKTVKGLMYNTPFYVNANSYLIERLQEKGYYILNEEFEGKDFENYKNFCKFMNNCSDDEFDNLYDVASKRAKDNKIKLFEYIYSDKVNEIKLLIG